MHVANLRLRRTFHSTFRLRMSVKLYRPRIPACPGGLTFASRKRITNTPDAPGLSGGIRSGALSDCDNRLTEPALTRSKTFEAIIRSNAEDVFRSAIEFSYVALCKNTFIHHRSLDPGGRSPAEPHTRARAELLPNRFARTRDTQSALLSLPRDEWRRKLRRSCADSCPARRFGDSYSRRCNLSAPESGRVGRHTSP
jgi:hypothetical protein